jgi:DNA-binding transcriptional LysR family regulator
VDRIEAMRVFVTVAEQGGFAPAARRLSLSPPVVTRAIASLEERVGSRLLQRTTRVVRLTEAGERYLADCQRILRDIEEAEASASSSHRDPRGRLVISASLNFGRMYVAPVVLDFLARHPQISVRTLLADNVVDLIEDGVDVAVRIAHLADSSLTAVRVGTVRRVVCASPEYLAARGTPKQPREVSSHDALVFSRDAAQRDWVFGPPRAAEKVELRSQLSVNNADVIIAAALAGRGLARVLSYQIGAYVKTGQLKIVLADHEPPPLPVSIVHAAGRKSSARVREFVTFAVERLRAAHWLG